MERLWKTVDVNMDEKSPKKSKKSSEEKAEKSMKDFAVFVCFYTHTWIECFSMKNIKTGIKTKAWRLFAYLP